MRTLTVGVAFPDPPFNGMPDDGGLDIDLMTAVADTLGVGVEFVPYEGADFNGIFDALDAGDYDCVAAGTTVTPEREKKAKFAPPYLISGQSLAVDTRRLPGVHVGRRPRGSDYRRATGQHQRADRRKARRRREGSQGPGLRTTAASAPRSTTSPPAAATRS